MKKQAIGVRKKIFFTCTRELVGYNEQMVPLKLIPQEKMQSLFILKKKSIIVLYNSVTDDLKTSYLIQGKRELKRGRNNMELGVLYGTFNF